MVRSRDTSADSHARQMSILRAMTPEQRLVAALQLSDQARSLTEAGIRRRRPTLSEAEVLAELREIVLRAAHRADSLTPG